MASSRSSNKRPRDIVSILEVNLWELEPGRILYLGTRHIVPVIRQLGEVIEKQVMPAMASFIEQASAAFGQVFSALKIPAELLSDERDSSSASTDSPDDPTGSDTPSTNS